MNEPDDWISRRCDKLNKFAKHAAHLKYLYALSNAKRRKAINDASIDQARLSRQNIIAAVIIGTLSIAATIIIGIVFSR